MVAALMGGETVSPMGLRLPPKGLRPVLSSWRTSEMALVLGVH